MVALLTPGVIELIVGAPDVVKGIAFTLAEDALLPTPLTARTETG
jgi:hypothetical protein